MLKLRAEMNSVTAMIICAVCCSTLTALNEIYDGATVNAIISKCGTIFFAGMAGLCHAISRRTTTLNVGDNCKVSIDSKAFEPKKAKPPIETVTSI